MKGRMTDKQEKKLTDEDKDRLQLWYEYWCGEPECKSCEYAKKDLILLVEDIINQRRKNE